MAGAAPPGLDRQPGPRAAQRLWARSHRVDAGGYRCRAGERRAGGAEGADREPAGTVECELGENPAEQSGELAGVARARADQDALRPGHVVGDEVPVGWEVIAARAGVELWPSRAGQVALQEGKHP